MTQQNKQRMGQPVIALGIILLLWVGVRSIFWNSPFPEMAPPVEHLSGNENALARADNGRETAILLAKAGDGPRRQSAPRIALASMEPPFKFSAHVVSHESRLYSVQPARQHGRATPWAIAALPDIETLPSPSGQVPAATIAPQLVGPEDHSANQSAGIPLLLPRRTGERVEKVWSFDGWVLLRQGNSGKNNGVLPASYGASQAGGIMRYRLAQKSNHGPAAYVRVTKALSGEQEGDIAAGMLARPIPRLPMIAQAEIRLSRVDGRTEVRPAVLAVTQLPPVRLPLDLQGEVYVQGGYVAGDFPTFFVDGQARMDREIAAIGKGKFRLGAGAWGGAQKGAEKIDVGPTAAVDLKLGDGSFRVSVDYRHRILGEAAPHSGVAVTVSTGF